MYDIYTQLALRNQLIKQALYNQLVREALIKYAAVGKAASDELVQQLLRDGAILLGGNQTPAGAPSGASANPPAGASASASTSPPAVAPAGASGNAVTEAASDAVTKFRIKGPGFLKNLHRIFRRYPFRTVGSAAGLLGLGYLGPKFLSGLYHFILPNNTSVPPPHISGSDLLQRLSPGVGIGALAGAGLAGLSSLTSPDPRAREAAINNALLGALLGGVVGGGASYLGYL